MNKAQKKQGRVLAIAPCTRGFGFAVMEGEATLVDWGSKLVEGDKNAGCLIKIKEMVAHYEPSVLVLEDCSVRECRRSARIRLLIKRITKLAAKHSLTVKSFSREQVKKLFFPDGDGTKHAVAEILARRFPAELGFRLPPERRPWMSEDSRMNIFDAVALALAVRLNK